MIVTVNHATILGRFGPDHPDTLFSKSNLGVALQDPADYLEAKQVLRDTLEVRCEVATVFYALGASRMSTFLPAVP
jgi:hypothetical protein